MAKKAATSRPGTGGPGSRKAAANRGARKRGGRGRRGRKARKRKQKKKHKCGDSGSYGKMKRNYLADGKERDHVPSCAALISNAKNNIFKGSTLCPKQENAIVNAASACAIPKPVHDNYSETHSWKNNVKDRNGKTRAERDGNMKKKAANRDTAAIKKGLDEKKASKECKKKYNEWADKVNQRDQKWYENMIRTAANKAT